MKRWGSPKAWKKSVKVRTTSDVWTAGNRPGVARALGLDEDVPSRAADHDANTCDVFGCEECLRPASGEAF